MWRMVTPLFKSQCLSHPVCSECTRLKRWQMYCQCTKNGCVYFAVTREFLARCHKWHCKTVIFDRFPFHWSVTNNNQMKSFLNTIQYKKLPHGLDVACAKTVEWHPKLGTSPPGEEHKKVRGPLPLQGSYLLPLPQSCQSNARNTDSLGNVDPRKEELCNWAMRQAKYTFTTTRTFYSEAETLLHPCIGSSFAQYIYDHFNLLVYSAHWMRKTLGITKVELPSSTLHVSVTVRVLFSWR